MKKLRRILLSLITNPILLIAYGVFFYKLAEICRYGRRNHNLQILMLLVVFFIIAIIVVSIKVIINSNYNKFSQIKPWKYTSIAIIIVITSFYGYNIYKSSVNFGGKLSWLILRAKTERKVDFEHNNFYKHGVAGIFNDINEKIPLPKELHTSNNVEVKFNSDGTITDFYAYVYGKNENKENECFTISYDSDKNPESIYVYLSSNEKSKYSEENLIDPLVETVKVININKTYLQENEDKYALLYSGKRNWGYDTTGLINIYEDGKEMKLEKVYNENLNDFKGEITGYTVSMYVPNKEGEITPFRYNLINDSSWSLSQNIMPGRNNEEEKEPKNPNGLNRPFKTTNKEEFYLSKKVGYKLNPVDAALGATFYELQKTIDGGKVWITINDNPLGDAVGSISGINFINEKVGFIVTVNKSGDTASLYRSEDGGESFEVVEYNQNNEALENGLTTSIFDFPTLPYLEGNDVLRMLVGQGQDGDYNGDNTILYESKDGGKTWTKTDSSI